MDRDPATARVALEETDRTSWRLIWEELETHLSSATKMNSSGPNPLKPQPIAALTAPPAIEQAPLADVTASPAQRLSKTSPFRDLERGAELAAIYLNANARIIIG